MSAIVVPEDKDAKQVLSTAFNKYHLSLGAGLTEVAGKVFRIGHLGDLNDLSLLGTLSGVEMGLDLIQIPIREAGVEKAREYLKENL